MRYVVKARNLIWKVFKNEHTFVQITIIQQIRNQTLIYSIVNVTAKPICNKLYRLKYIQSK